MLSILRAACISLTVLLLSACHTLQLGKDFDVHAFESRIERGVTTQNQVRGWLGAPTSSGVGVGTDGERFDEWTYYFAAGKLSDMSNANVKMLQVKFDKQGIVRGYNWSASGK